MSKAEISMIQDLFQYEVDGVYLLVWKYGFEPREENELPTCTFANHPVFAFRFSTGNENTSKQLLLIGYSGGPSFKCAFMSSDSSCIVRYARDLYKDNYEPEEYELVDIRHFFVPLDTMAWIPMYATITTVIVDDQDNTKAVFLFFVQGSRLGMLIGPHNETSILFNDLADNALISIKTREITGKLRILEHSYSLKEEGYKDFFKTFEWLS